MVNKMKEDVLINRRWIVLAIVICVFVILAENVLANEKIIFDSVVYGFMVNHRNDILTGFFKIITKLASPIFLCIITIIGVIVVKDRKHKIAIPLNLFLVAALNFILKNIFLRPRPNELRIIDETGFSFPSGHSMISTAFYGYLIYMIYKNVKDVKTKRILCALLGVLIFLICISRIYLGVHYTSDVIAGFCMSIAYLILLINMRIL